MALRAISFMSKFLLGVQPGCLRGIRCSFVYFLFYWLGNHHLKTSKLENPEDYPADLSPFSRFGPCPGDGELER